MVNPFVYQDVFSGSNIYPSDSTYAAITLTSDVSYSWPLESSPGINNLLPRILDVTCNTYKTFSYTNAGSVNAAAAVGATTVVITPPAGSITPVQVGQYLTLGPNTNLSPVIYKVIGVVILGVQTTVTLESGLQTAWAAGATVYTFAFTPWTITLPNAEETGLGQTCLIASKSSLAFFSVATLGPNPVQVLFVQPSTVWQIYLTDNSTPQGVWANFQYGAALAAYQASGLAGPGLTFYSNALATAYPVTTFSGNYTVSPGDRALTYVWTGTSGTLSLSAANTLTNNWYMNVRNQGTGLLTIAAGGTDLLNGINSVGLDPGDSLTIITDGINNFYSLGFGRSLSATFDYVVIDLTGLSGNYVVSAQNQNRIAYNFTGAIAGNITIIVPQYVQQYWVANNTTTGGNNYTLTVRTSNASDTGLVVRNGSRAIYYSTGTAITQADNNGLTLPVDIIYGGTGATTAQSALINFGGGGVGINVFKAASAAAVITALGGAATVQTALNFSAQGSALVAAFNTAGAISALGGAQAVASAIGAASVGDILALSIALS